MARILMILPLAFISLTGCQTSGSDQGISGAQPGTAAAAGAAGRQGTIAASAGTSSPEPADQGVSARPEPDPDWLPLFTSGPLTCSAGTTLKMNRRLRATQSGVFEVSHGPDTLVGSWELTGTNTISRTLPTAGTDTNEVYLSPDGQSLNIIGVTGEYQCVPAE